MRNSVRARRTEITPSGTSTQVQCDAGGFIVELEPSVDPNEFASTLPSGAEVSASEQVIFGPAYNAQIFDLVAASPYVLVTLTPTADAGADPDDQHHADGCEGPSG